MASKVSSEYRTWSGMIQRCTNPNDPRFKSYGGRGITVCDRWRKFSNFVADMGAKPQGLSLDRRDNSLGYCPENCRWATTKEQARNKRDNRFIEWNGEVKTITDWADSLGIKRGTLNYRLIRGWPLNVAMQKNGRNVSPEGRRAASKKATTAKWDKYRAKQREKEGVPRDSTD